MFGVRLSVLALGLALFLAGCQTTGVAFKSGSLVGGTNASALTIPGLLFKPTGTGPFPAVVLLHTCGGLTPHMRQGWPDFLTANGYVVFAVDSYPPRGHRSCDQFPTRFEWEIGQAEDAFGALDYLATQPFVDGDRIGVMGFSAGAYAINHLVIGAPRGKARQFKAAISFYGSCDFSSLINYSTNDLPLLQVAAERDTKLAPHCVRLGKRTQMQVLLLEGTYHAFDQPQITRLRYDNGGHPMLYSLSATNRARRASKDFLDRHLK